jgi:hypothetical protein
MSGNVVDLFLKRRPYFGWGEVKQPRDEYEEYHPLFS